MMMEKVEREVGESEFNEGMEYQDIEGGGGIE
jgi:hypothetical protein